MGVVNPGTASMLPRSANGVVDNELEVRPSRG